MRRDDGAVFQGNPLASIYQLKPAFQDLLRPLVRALANAGVTANQVTLAAVALAFAVGAALLLCDGRAVLLLLPLALFLRMALNAIDGMLAREHGQMSRLGAILNELGDVLADAAMYVPLALRAEFPEIAVVVLVLLATVVEMTGVIGVQVGASRRYDGPFGKSDRAFAFGALGLALGLGAPAGAWLDVLLWLLVALSSITVVNRARRALAELQSRETSE
jgi:CDP-diacylglycerol--glycerol-3-phosphate 3-phosphatidyltransferase